METGELIMDINKQLEVKIVERYGTIKNFANHLRKAPTTIYNLLNKDLSNATSLTIKTICEALEIDMYSLLAGEIKDRVNPSFAITQKEKNIIEQYRQLDDFGVKAMDLLLEIEYERNQFYANEIPNTYKFLYDLPAAAGRGTPLDDQNGELVKIPKTRDADFSDYIVRVSGDSMEEDYSDGDYVLVRSQPDIDIGQVGIFVLNGEGYIKEKGYGVLISRNSKYEPIKINEWDDLRCCGLVLGKTEILEE